MEQFLYYRSLSKSSDIWRKGKDIKSFPPDVEKSAYLSHMTTGKGFPSIWKSSNNEELEKIALGFVLCKGSLDRVEFIGLNKCCFENSPINIVHVPNSQFPLPSVGNLHHELLDVESTNIITSIELFLRCNGEIRRFPKISDSKTETSMLSIVKKYVGEVSGEKHIKKANEWIEKYGKSQVSENSKDN